MKCGGGSEDLEEEKSLGFYKILALSCTANRLRISKVVGEVKDWKVSGFAVCFELPSLI